jgi:hypothetical protein
MEIPDSDTTARRKVAGPATRFALAVLPWAAIAAAIGVYASVLSPNFQAISQIVADGGTVRFSPFSNLAGPGFPSHDCDAGSWSWLSGSKLAAICVPARSVSFWHRRLIKRDLAAMGRLRELKNITLVKASMAPGAFHLYRHAVMRCRGLRSLALVDTDAPSSAFKGIATLRHLAKFVCIDSTRLGDRGLAWISASRSITSLNLSGDMGITGGGQLGPMGQIESLNLSGTSFGDRGFAWLRGLVTLQRLNLARDRSFTGSALTALRALPDLRELNLDDTGVGDGSLASLMAIPKLHRVSLRGTRFTVGAINRLRKFRPSLEVRYGKRHQTLHGGAYPPPPFLTGGVVHAR